MLLRASEGKKDVSHIMSISEPVECLDKMQRLERK